MTNVFARQALGLGLCLGLAVVLTSCSQPAGPAGSSATSSNSAAPARSTSSTATTLPASGAEEKTAPPVTRSKRFVPVQLGGSDSTANANPVALSAEARQESVMNALKPLQVLMGQWHATTRKALLDEPDWVWDLQTNPDQPALVLASEKGAYFRTARLSFDPSVQQFTLDTVDGEGQSRRYVGDFTEPVKDEYGDDKKLHRSFKLELTQVAAADTNELWQVILSQHDNNRYIVELNRKRGQGNFVRVDTINTQREGTSFAISDTDYGDKTCIISQGLGTISVSYQGQTFWVCCTGCEAAFNEDPQRWIAKLEERKKEEMKQ